MPTLGPFTLLAYTFAGLVLCLGGLVLVCFGIGSWGKRKAQREGRVCPDCGLWDDPVDILIHRIRKHERDETP